MYRVTVHAHSDGATEAQWDNETSIDASKTLQDWIGQHFMTEADALNTEWFRSIDIWYYDSVNPQYTAYIEKL
jgi:hypothetical protein